MHIRHIQRSRVTSGYKLATVEGVGGGRCVCGGVGGWGGDTFPKCYFKNRSLQVQ